jgi:hypothetical protein
MVYSIILIILAAICNGVMDNITHHWSTSKLNKYNEKFWNPELSWKNKYIDNDPKKGYKKLFWKIEKPVALTDAWHLFKSLMIIFVCLAIVLYTPLIIFYIDFVILGILWNIIFNLFYDKILKKND